MIVDAVHNCAYKLTVDDRIFWYLCRWIDNKRWSVLRLYRWMDEGWTIISIDPGA